MATLGKNWSQQLGFTLTTTAGTVYTHGLGFTPTVVILTPYGASGTAMSPGYTAAGTNLITITGAIGSPAGNLDVTVGRFHSLIK